MKVFKKFIGISFVFAFGMCYGQTDSSHYCKQYMQAIDYLRKEAMIKSAFQLDDYRFQVSNHLVSGGIDPTFFEQFMSYFYKKPFDSIDKKLIDATYGKIVEQRVPTVFTIKCLSSDNAANLKLNFARDNDTVFGITISAIENLSINKKHKKTRSLISLEIGLDYLFIFNRENNIEFVLKKEIVID